MKKLKKYINTFPKSERSNIRKHIAKVLGVTPGYVIVLACGHRRVRERYAIKIEKATNGYIKRSDIFPGL